MTTKEFISRLDPELTLEDIAELAYDVHDNEELLDAALMYMTVKGEFLEQLSNLENEYGSSIDYSGLS